jgi:hypothetical protein
MSINISADSRCLELYLNREPNIYMKIEGLPLQCRIHLNLLDGVLGCGNRSVCLSLCLSKRRMRVVGV